MITSRLLSSIPGIVHGFGTAAELVPASLADRWELRPDKRQVHGRALAEVMQPEQLCGEVDGIYSAARGIPIAVVTADCVPILLARRDGAMVAALHAGWRGLAAGLIETLWTALRARGEQPQQWVAVIGPAVGACCYEVSLELVMQFQQQFDGLAPERVSPAHRRLDLSAIAEYSLQRAGVGEIEALATCTLCSVDAAAAPRFRSYRRGDRGSQQHSGLMIV